MSRRQRDDAVPPTPEQLAKGGYARRYTLDEATGQMAKTFVSRHDPVERWKAGGRLEAHQVAAIDLCRHLWDIAGLPIRVTASYGERIPITSSSERLNNAQIDARERLYRIMDYFAGLEKWWAIFENVCRHGEPAGIAGSRLGYRGSNRSDDVRAHTVVCFVADKIAEQERL